MSPHLEFNYDYSKCMVMKLGLAYPEKDEPNKSHVLMNFVEALEYIIKVNNMTPGITKIYYLVGWQYLGHDDKYPDFFEVNEALKRPEDKTAYYSFKWLCEEGKKYNSVVSVHINFNDAYDNAPSFDDFVKAGALIRKKNGKIHPIEKYNGRKCHKTCHKAYWESGLFKRQIDKFFNIFPFLQECGTIHVDNFQCYKNYAPYVSIEEMQAARKKMIEYVKSKGVDITSEFTYKERPILPNRPIFGLPRDHIKSAPMNTLGLIPLSWWCYRITRKELIEISPQIYCGGVFREKRLNKYLYGNMHGEDIITKSNENWAEDFLYQFATYQVPYHFLCTKKRLAIKGLGCSEYCIHSDGVVSYCKNSRITENGETIKNEDDVFLPYIHKGNAYLAYSKNGTTCKRKVSIKTGVAEIFEITENGLKSISEIEINDNKIQLEVKPKQALLITVKE